jgi:hypothetical protein
MDGDAILGPRRIRILESGWMTRRTDMELIFGATVEDTMERGRMIRDLEREPLCGLPLVVNTMENGKMINVMDTESSFGKTATSTRDNGKTANVVERVNSRPLAKYIYKSGTNRRISIRPIRGISRVWKSRCLLLPLGNPLWI